MYRKKNPVPMYTWVLPLVMAVLGEALVHLWTMESFVPGRFAAVVVFALGFGCILAAVSSLFNQTGIKLVAGIIAFLEVFLFLAELLIHDTFQVFMGLGTIGAGAGGVVTNYMRIVLEEILTNWWKILLLLIPIALYVKLVEPLKVSWKSTVALAVSAVLLYALGVGVVHWTGTDRDKMGDGFNFDSAVRSFGVHMGFVLDGMDAVGLLGSELDFDVPEKTAPSTDASGTAATGGSDPTAPAETDPEETVAETEPSREMLPHVYDIDFAALAETESDANVASLHQYVASQTPAMENEYTGLFEGKNLIFITAEAFTGVFIDPELTPTLYRLATQGIQFTDYYQPVWGAGTTGGEYANLVGLVPKNGSCMQETLDQDLFLTIGSQLQALGYSSAAFHNNSYTYYDRDRTHMLLGYDYFMGYGNGMEAGVQNLWPQSDLEMIDFTVPLYIDQQPFSVYYMTVSGHSPYSRGNSMVEKNYEKVKGLDAVAEVKYYIATQLELEAALTSLLAQLEEAGIMDDTVIVLSSDHYPYGLVTDDTTYIDDLMGVQYVNDFNRDQNTLIIWSGCIEDMDIVVDDPVMSLDILPTLSNLFGVEYDSRLLVGRDVFSDTDPLVMWGISGSWKTDKGTYSGYSNKFTPAEGAEIPDDYVATINAIVSNKMKYCRAVANYDYFNYVKAALEDAAE